MVASRNYRSRSDGEIFRVLIGKIDVEHLWDEKEGLDIRRRVQYVKVGEDYLVLSVGKAFPKHFPNLVFKYLSLGYGPRQYHFLQSPSHNCIDTTRKLLSMMKSNILQGAKKNVECSLLSIQAKLAIDEHHILDKSEIARAKANPRGRVPPLPHNPPLTTPQPDSQQHTNNHHHQQYKFTTTKH